MSSPWAIRRAMSRRERTGRVANRAGRGTPGQGRWIEFRAGCAAASLLDIAEAVTVTHECQLERRALREGETFRSSESSNSEIGLTSHTRATSTTRRSTRDQRERERRETNEESAQKAKSTICCWRGKCKVETLACRRARTLTIESEGRDVIFYANKVIAGKNKWETKTDEARLTSSSSGSSTGLRLLDLGRGNLDTRRSLFRSIASVSTLPPAVYEGEISP